ncbi:MAG: hypothetical protein ACK55I_33355, partial [bacterium]
MGGRWCTGTERTEESCDPVPEVVAHLSRSDACCSVWIDRGPGEALRTSRAPQGNGAGAPDEARFRASSCAPRL